MIIFDIGANNGSSCSHLATEDNVVYAFEPTPHLIEKFLKKLENEKYIIVPYAVSDYNGVSKFNIAGQADWGCSSLNNFSDDLNVTWPGRDDFKVTDIIDVNVIRLDTFIEKNNIEVIDYLHCDTQGNDYKVLLSLGKYINILKSGVVEGYKQNALYKESDNTVENITNYLKENRFNIDSIESNDPHDNEFNIFFSK
jgi:FkbM family methyltransferase